MKLDQSQTNGLPSLLDFPEHDKTAKLVESVHSKQVYSATKYDSMVESGKLDKEKCKIILETPDYADYNWTAHPALDKIYGDGFIDKLQKALIDITDEELLKALTRSKIISAKNEDFKKIEDIANELGFLNN